MTSLLIDKDGVRREVSCTEDIARIITSQDTDDDVKEIIINSLLAQPIIEHADRGATADRTVPDNSSANQVWTKAAAKLLLEENRKIEESKQPTKNRWKKISLTLAQFDHHFSAEQCRLKYRAIKDKYQKNKKKSNTSGEAGSSNDQTALLDDVFERCPDVTPTATIDSDSLPASTSSASASNSSVSASTSSASASNSSASASASAIDAATDNDESDTLPKTKLHVAKRRRSGADEIKEFLKEREEDQERRHQERMSTAKELINLLAKLVDKS